MPRDMFGEVDRPSTRVGTRSRYSVPLSLAAHALVVAGILAATVLGPAVLPSPATGELILIANMAIPEPPPPLIVAERVTDRDSGQSKRGANGGAGPHRAGGTVARRRRCEECHRDGGDRGDDGLQHGCR